MCQCVLHLKPQADDPLRVGLILTNGKLYMQPVLPASKDDANVKRSPTAKTTNPLQLSPYSQAAVNQICDLASLRR